MFFAMLAGFVVQKNCLAKMGTDIRVRVPVIVIVVRKADPRRRTTAKHHTTFFNYFWIFLSYTFIFLKSSWKSSPMCSADFLDSETRRAPTPETVNQ